MKRIIILALLAAATSATFAAPANLSLSKKTTGPIISWAINNPNTDILTITNSSGSNFNLMVSTNPSRFNPFPATLPTDITTVICNGKPTEPVTPGSAVVCSVAPNSNAQIMVLPTHFKNGSEGVYAIVN